MMLREHLQSDFHRTGVSRERCWLLQTTVTCLSDRTTLVTASLGMSNSLVNLLFPLKVNGCLIERTTHCLAQDRTSRCQSLLAHIRLPAIFSLEACWESDVLGSLVYVRARRDFHRKAALDIQGEVLLVTSLSLTSHGDRQRQPQQLQTETMR